MLHVVDVANSLRFAHLTLDIRSPEVFNVNTDPAAVGHTRSRPLTPTRRGTLIFARLEWAARGHSVQCIA